MTFVSSGGSHVLPLRIIRRGVHSSAISSKDKRLPSLLKRYCPGAAQAVVPPVDTSSSCPVFLVQLPFSLGQPAPSSVNVPAGSKRTVKTPYFSGSEGRSAAALGFWCFSMYFLANSIRCAPSRRFPILCASRSEERRVGKEG